jgi:hypothetical protein
MAAISLLPIDGLVVPKTGGYIITLESIVDKELEITEYGIVRVIGLSAFTKAADHSQLVFGHYKGEEVDRIWRREMTLGVKEHTGHGLWEEGTPSSCTLSETILFLLSQSIWPTGSLLIGSAHHGAFLYRQVNTN